MIEVGAGPRARRELRGPVPLRGLAHCAALAGHISLAALRPRCSVARVARNLQRLASTKGKPIKLEIGSVVTCRAVSGAESPSRKRLASASTSRPGVDSEVQTIGRFPDVSITVRAAAPAEIWPRTGTTQEYQRRCRCGEQQDAPTCSHGAPPCVATGACLRRAWRSPRVRSSTSRDCWSGNATCRPASPFRPQREPDLG